MMVQSITHACTNCGTSVPTNMGFCPNCGTSTSSGADNPASNAPTQKAPPPHYTVYPQQAQPVYQPAPSQQGYQPPLQSSQPPVAYARPQKKSSRGILK